ncbi:hypothetical protein AAE478_005563 [Parahypoxylon ruwenzoriense]
MLQSRLLRCSLLIALGTIGVWANEDVVDVGRGPVSHKGAPAPREEPCLWELDHIVVEKDSVAERFVLEGLPDPPRRSPAEQAVPALTTPKPTAPPQKRQDDGQIQALSSQLRSLSESATQAISSVSSSASSAMSLVSQSAQSVRQSADQAVRSANQNADQANRQLSQTQSSASSAVSRANDQISQSLSSMSSRISANLASVQSSANSVISVARAEASSSAANAVNIAASQIQEARADASGVRGDADSIVTQVQSNSISGTNVAIIVTVAVIGTAILTTIASCFVVRYRRKKRRDREGLTAANEKQYERPLAVRGTSGSPRFTPFGGGTGYPMDKFKLPDISLSPFLKKKTNEDGQSEIGFSRSDISPMDALASSSSDVYGVSPTSFRLQKDSSVKSATSVRLIRVGGNGGKAVAKDDDQEGLISPATSPSPPPPLPLPLPTQMAAPPASFVPASIPPRPRTPEPPSPVEPPPTQPAPVATRSSRLLEMSKLNRNTIHRTMTSQQRLRFRDSSDIESAEPTPTIYTATMATSMRNTNTASLRAVTANNVRGSDDEQSSPPRRPKNAGASFATFPRVRNSPPRGSAAEAIMNRNRAGLNGITARLREEAERRRREAAEFGISGAGQPSDIETTTKGQNWPFGSG